MHTISETIEQRRESLIRQMRDSREGLSASLDEGEGRSERRAPPRSAASAMDLGKDLAALWWQQHPWREKALTLEANTRVLVQPLADRHPALLLGASAVAGALGAWLLPGRLRALAVPYLSAQAFDLARAAGSALMSRRVD